MSRPLRVLNVEDDPADTELLLLELRRAGFDPSCQRVQTESDFLAHLGPELDLILSDYSMPEFSGLRALELLNERALDIPFILVSGTIGEETAVAAMRNGASDYLLKDRLARLGPAVIQALDKSRLHREQKQIETKFRRLVEQVITGVYIVQDDRFAYVNPKMAEILGYSEAEMTSHLVYDFVVEKYHDTVRKNLALRLSGEVETIHYELQMLRKDGSVITAEAHGGRTEHDGRPAVLGTLLDVTQRMQADKRIREQAEMLAHARDAIIVRDIQTYKITFWNHGAERLYGWTAEEADGRDIRALLSPHSIPTDTVTRQLLASGEWRGEGGQVTKSGKKLTISSNITLMRDENGEPKSALIINIDITDQKLLEARLLRAQRLESIGTLASGVAHDLNNILAPILMSVAILRRELNPEHREGILATIELSAEHGAEIVKQVLTFGRGVEGEKRPTPIDRLLAEMGKIIRGTFPKNIMFESTVGAGLWKVIGDATQIQQVLMNLCVNARDAMPEGGTLRLNATNLDVDVSYAAMTGDATPGPHVVVEVSDSGTGIPPEIAERIFEPFFTTKALGVGTGLGLSTVHGIVRSHGGFIKLASELGRGTTFQVFLPASPTMADAADSSGTQGEIPNGRGETVLVVDDEMNVRNCVRAVLEASGFKTLLCADGTEALGVFAKNSDRISIMLTDLMMPFMDGVALVRAIRKMGSSVPVIASTGLGEKAKLAELKTMGVEILHKPYGAETLLRSIQRTLHPQLEQKEITNTEGL